MHPVSELCEEVEGNHPHHAYVSVLFSCMTVKLIPTSQPITLKRWPEHSFDFFNTMANSLADV